MTLKKKLLSTALMGSFALVPLSGCESLPGNGKSQGAVIGGAGGAAAGAAVSKNNRLLGALIGGALGAGGGYLIGANRDKTSEKDREDAITASQKAERNPASASDVANSRTADLNSDGFVTLDEVVAMEQADLSRDEMIRRLERTQQVFELTGEQERYLRDRGVDRDVIVAMQTMNQDLGSSARVASDRDDLDREPDRLDDRDRFDSRDRLDSDRYDDRPSSGTSSRSDRLDRYDDDR